MKRRTLLSLAAGAILLAAPSLMVAQQTGTGSTDVPRTISYQGLLTSRDGTPMPNGSYDITVALYADQEGSRKVWQATYPATVFNGIFNLYLGAGDAPLPDPGQMNRPLWVGTSVNGTEQMIPLTPLTASPYALNLPDNAVSTSKLADKAVTAQKVDMNYVAGFRVNGEEIAGNGAMLNIQSGKDINVRYDEIKQSLVIEAKGGAGTEKRDEEKGAGVLDLMPAIQNWIGRAGFGGILNPPVIQGGTTFNTIAAGSNTLIATAADYSSIVGGSINIIDTASDYDFIGGGLLNHIDDTSHYNSISGGQENYIGDKANHNCIGCGDSNVILNESHLNVIGGGGHNLINSVATYNSVGGGSVNTIARLSDYNVIGGGNTNTIHEGDYNTIGGGENNVTGVAGGAGVDDITIGGGRRNTATGAQSTIGGGTDNLVVPALATVGGGGGNAVLSTGPEGTIAGGHFDTVKAYVGAIAGGHNNTIEVNGEAGFIGGGRNSIVDTKMGAIGGGRRNNIMVNSDFSFIGGGDTNSIGGTVMSDHSTIGGGQSNKILADHATIGGGLTNIVTGPNSIIGGGQVNSVTAANSAITGGQNNSVSGTYSIVGGGVLNTITGAPLATIGGGGNNTITATGAEATIAGGHINRVESYVSAICGGHDGIITINGRESFIGGGRRNYIDVNNGAIGGGMDNRIQAGAAFATIGGGQGNIVNGLHTTIPGGDMLLTLASYAQTAVGFFNAPRGAVGFRPAPGALTNDPLFMVGNGDGTVMPAVRANAFEVSYNGHSVVSHTNGTGAVTGAVTGGTYVDNVIYAWADVAANGMLICNDFGVAMIQHPAPGVYRVTLNIVGPDGITPATINCGAAVATLGTGNPPSTGLPTGPPAGYPCAQIFTTSIAGNIFDVFITQQNVAAGRCDIGIDLPFKFHVTGRP